MARNFAISSLDNGGMACRTTFILLASSSSFLSMILSENRFPLFGIMLHVPPPRGAACHAWLRPILHSESASPRWSLLTSHRGLYDNRKDWPRLHRDRPWRRDS